MTDLLDAPLGFVGRFEALHVDFRRACGLVGLPARELPRLHQATGSVEYDDDTRAVIAEHYRDDFSLYGYAI